MQFTFGFATSDQIAILLNKNIYKHTGHLRLSIHQVVVQFVYVLIRTSYNLAGFSFIYLYLCVCVCIGVFWQKECQHGSSRTGMAKIDYETPRMTSSSGSRVP